MKEKRIVSLIGILILSSLLSVTLLQAAPEGPTIEILGNTTRETSGGSIVNSSINGTISPGGFIFTAGLTALQQNVRWKGYVGNVTGTLTLDDAAGNTVFQWTLTTISGEVYATRSSGSINWSGINCTWVADGRYNSTEGFVDSNRTPEHDENVALSHTSSDDNITATFVNTNHSELDIGGRIIGEDECFSVQPYHQNTTQSFDDSDTANFTQVILYDGAFNVSGHNLVYTTEIETDQNGYRDDETYDFQMILPEDATSGFTGSTGYYFYVELA